MPDGQDELIKSVAAENSKTIVVINTGATIDMSAWINDVDAVIMAWFPGQAGGRAIADVIFGKINPSGKLPTSFIKRLEDSSAFGHYHTEGGDISFDEGIMMGYRHLDNADIEPAFPFGYGLSYSSFIFSDISLSAKKITKDENIKCSLQVKNNSDRDGAEVVQLYLQDCESSVVRPPKELKGFKKIFLLAGEQKEVNFELTLQDLSFYDDKIHAWRAEAGCFKVCIGNSFRDIHLNATFELVD